MSDGAISQDEIDALLAGVDMGGLSASGSSAPSPAVNIDTAVIGSVANSVKVEADRAKAEVDIERKRIDGIVEKDTAQDALIAANDAAIKAEAQTARAAEEALDARIKAFE